MAHARNETVYTATTGVHEITKIIKKKKEEKK
jgi:hypothetical protein